MLAVIGAMKEEVDLLEAETTVSEWRVHASIEVIRGRFRGTGSCRACATTDIWLVRTREGAGRFRLN